jgi:hypothetical protein
MRHEGVVRVRWTRSELTAIREAIEVTPNFEGRLEVREILRAALRAPRLREITFEYALAEKLGGRLVPIDGPTAMARAKLLLAVRGPRKRSIAEHGRLRRPALVPARPVTPQVAPPIAASAAA